MRHKYFTLFIFIFLPLSSHSLSLQEYLDQVVKNHEGLQGSLMARDGAALHSKDGELLVAPTAFANISLSHDQKVDPLFRTSETVRNEYSLGVSQQTTFGLLARLYYTYDYQYYNFLPDAFSPPIRVNQGRPTIELTQSLLKNGFGSLTRAQIEATEAGALASSFLQSYQTRGILAQAEAAYWTLSLARSSVRVAMSVLDRAKELYEWNFKRERLRLVDASDVVQSEALLKLRQLDYQQSIDNQRMACRSFNQLRGQDSDEVSENVEPLGRTLVMPTDLPARAQMREDVRAAQEQSVASQANSKLSYEKDRATLDVFVSYSTNGSDVGIGATVGDSFQTSQPTYTGGLRFAMPLDFGNLSNAKKGYNLEEEGAAKTYQRKYFDQENEWRELSQRLSEAKARLALSQTLEDIQKQKLKVERERLNHGKTTTFNVIQFEQDAAQAELGSLRAQADILQIIAQMKTFGGPI